MGTFLVYAVCFGVGLLFAIISAFTTHIFGGHDAHTGPAGVDGSDVPGFGDGHVMPGFAPLSPTTISAFVTAFGGFGMIFSRFEATKSPLISAPLSVLGGLGIAFGVFALFRSIFRKTQSSSEAHVADAVGQIATVITPIPAGGVGEIAYILGGTRYTAPARSEGGTAVGGSQPVKITRIAGTQYYVSPQN